MAELLSSTYDLCQELSPRLDAAIEAGDGEGVLAAEEELLEAQSRLEAALRSASPKANAKTRRWLQVGGLGGNGGGKEEGNGGRKKR